MRSYAIYPPWKARWQTIFFLAYSFYLKNPSTVIPTMVLCFLFVLSTSIFFLNHREGFPSSLIEKLRTLKPSELDLYAITALFSFCSFCLIPLFLGLLFFLESDANVVVVLFFLVWTYNWARWIWKEEA